MKVTEINIERKASWDVGYDTNTPEMLIGTVKMDGPTGDMTLRITPAIVTQMLKLIEEDMAEQALLNARAAACAIKEVECESKLLAAPDPVDRDSEVPF